MNDYDVLDDIFYLVIFFLLLFSTFILGIEIGSISAQKNITNEEDNICMCCQKDL